jgi:hypothetical protein
VTDFAETNGSLRRFYLRKRLAATREGSNFIEVWKAKQQAEPGTALPADFPARAALISAGYSTAEDLDGADAAELRNNAGLRAAEAAAVLTAASALL